jgi:hypothetical protein
LTSKRPARIEQYNASTSAHENIVWRHLDSLRHFVRARLPEFKSMPAMSDIRWLLRLPAKTR